MRELLWNAPISESTMSDTIEALELSPEQSVLDVGCGCGEVLIRLHERFGISGMGVDVSGDLIREANKRAAGRVAGAVVQFSQADAQTLEVGPESVDLGMCMGATHAFGHGKDAYQMAIERLLRWIVPGGLLLIAEGYLKQPASPEYRAVIGEFPADETTHAANVSTGRDMGLIPLATWTSSLYEWDSFEWTYQRVIEQRAAERPRDAEAATKLKSRRAWMKAYLQWGRETLGYGTYLFKCPNR